MSQEHCPDTGELFDRQDFASAEYHSEQRQTLSEKAKVGIKAPGYWDKREGVMRSSSRRSFSLALLRVQSEIEAIVEADANNPFTKKKYASLGMILTKIRPVLKKHKFVIKQGAGKIFSHGKSENYFLPVFMELVHAPTAESERQLIEIPLTKIDPQAIGIAISYGRRYLLQSYFGMASMDDDAAGAVRQRIDKNEQLEALNHIIEQLNEQKTEKDLKKYGEQCGDQMTNFSDENCEKMREAYAKRLEYLKKKTKGEKDKKAEAQPTEDANAA